MASGDTWLNRQGTVVCRRCYYADQTQLQAERVKESEQEIGPYGAFVLGKRMLIGGLLLLLGAAGLLGAIRAGAWREAMWPALVLARGAGVVTIALRGARQPKD